MLDESLFPVEKQLIVDLAAKEDEVKDDDNEQTIPPPPATTTSATTTTSEYPNIEEDIETEVEEELEDEEFQVIPTQAPADKSYEEWWESRYLGIAIGILTTVIVLLVIVVILILHKERLLARSKHKRYASVSNLSGASHQFFAPASSSSTNSGASSELSYKARLCSSNSGGVEQLLHPIYTEPIFTCSGSTMQQQQQQHYLPRETVSNTAEDYPGKPRERKNNTNKKGDICCFSFFDVNTLYLHTCK